MTKLHLQDASPKMLEFVRLWVFGIWLLKITLVRTDSVGALPFSLYEPVRFFRLLPEFVSAGLLQADLLRGLKIVTLLTLVLVLLNFWKKAIAPAACVLLTVLEGILRGFGGHIHHTDLALLYAAYFLALFPLADGWAGRSDSSRSRRVNLSGIPCAAIVAFMCFTYLLTGVYRIAHAGIQVFTSDIVTYWTLVNSYSSPAGFWNLGKLLPDYPLLAFLMKLGYPVVTLFEILAPLCLVSRHFRYAFLAVMVPFHFFSWLFMKVFFWENLLLLVLFLDFNFGGRRRAASQLV